jgi:hypothetical protein
VTTFLRMGPSLTRQITQIPRHTRLADGLDTSIPATSSSLYDVRMKASARSCTSICSHDAPQSMSNSYCEVSGTRVLPTILEALVNATMSRIPVSRLLHRIQTDLSAARRCSFSTPCFESWLAIRCYSLLAWLLQLRPTSQPRRVFTLNHTNSAVVLILSLHLLIDIHTLPSVHYSDSDIAPTKSP